MTKPIRFSFAKHSRIKKVVLGLCLLVAIGVILLLMLVVYCFLPRAPKTIGELYGTYVLENELVVEELILHDDGTFTQKATIKATSETLSSNGTWTYNPNDGYVSLEGFLILLERSDEIYSNYARPVSASLPAEYWLGQIILDGWTDDRPIWRKVK